MKKTFAAFGLVFLLLGFGVCQQMTPQYDSYATYSMDANLNISQTVVLEGTATGSCYVTVVCGPNGQQCTYPIAACSNATHTPSITNVVGSAGGTSYAAAVNAFSYISYQTTTTVPWSPGAADVNYSWGTNISCSFSGGSTFFSSSGNPGRIGARVTTYSYLFTANNIANYVQACPAGTHSTCGAVNFTSATQATWAEEFHLWTSIFGCFPIGIAQYKNGPPAPYPCT